MLPNIWIFDTYSICLIIGVILSFYLFSYLGKYFGLKKNYIYDILILSCITVAFGILSASLFQYIFNLIDGLNKFGAMTFYGGLLGGAAIFIIGYFLFIKKRYPDESFLNILILVPSSITIAHAFGRIGCFLAGCCYGIETDSFLGVLFPGHAHEVYPTQLFESFFLFFLTFVLFMLVYKKKFRYTMSVYMIGYGTFRFLNEFLRGDERGSFIPGLSPAQAISIFLIIGGIILIFVLKEIYKKKDNIFLQE